MCPVVSPSRSMKLRLGAAAGALVIAMPLAGCGSGAVTMGPTNPGTPQLGLSATTLSFGTAALGASSAAQTITLTNSGTAALTLSSITASGDFAETSSGCGTGLAIGATCQVSVVFTPTLLGSRAGTLTLTSNAAASPQTVALSGTGAAAAGSFLVTVRAGAQPIVGASLQIYAAGTGGNGSAPTSLLSASVTTNGSGVAAVPAPTCSSGSAPVYLVSRGGAVGGSGGANANLALMTAIGPCSSVTAASSFVVDEATTVAAAYGLAQFYASGGSVGASATNLTGITNAFLTAATLADPAAGTSPGATLPSNASSPAQRVNSVANMLNACAVSATACATLYSATTAAGGAAPANTLDAAFALAHNPASNGPSLYALAKTSSAYAPMLSSAPLDWTMFIIYSGGGMNNPTGLGVDSTGSVWVASYYSVASKFSTTGAPSFANGITGSGLNNSYGLAIDLNDDVWIANEQPPNAQGTGSVTVLNSAGVALSGTTGYRAGGLNYPLSIAIDPNGTAWVVDYGDSYLTLLNAAGAPLSGTGGYTTSNFAFPVAVAIDGNHFGWVVNQSSNFVTKVAPDLSSSTNYLCCDQAAGIAIDQGNNLWVANYYGDSVSLMTNAGTVISNALTGAGSIYHPKGIAVDGAGTVWVANYRAPYLTELAGANASVPGAPLSPAAGLGGDAGQLEAYALALDASGNVWVSNLGSNTITKLIGLATPVKTPLSGLPRLP